MPHLPILCTSTYVRIRRTGKKKPPAHRRTSCSPDTHKAFTRHERGRLIVNPGSLGQPKQGGREACYAVWDGDIELRRSPYPIAETIAKIHRMPVQPAVREDLIAVLESGGNAEP